LQGSRIHAIAQPCRLGTIVKNVAEKAAAAAAEYLCAVAEEAIVRSGADVLRSDWRRKARPAGTGIVIVFRLVQIEPAGRTAVNAMLVMAGVFSGKSPFGPLLPQDVVLFGCQLFFLLFIALNNSFAHDIVPFFCGIDLDRNRR